MGLAVTIQNPTIVLKDRPYLVGNIEVDLGEIRVTSRTEEVSGRWA